MSQLRAARPRPQARPRREQAVLTCVCSCTILVVGFVASINLAVPKLAASSLRPSSSDLLWIVDAYVILFACLVIPAGALGDRIGRKGVLISGLIVFACGAGLSAGAGDVIVMLFGRAITGVGAAGVLPNALAVLVHAVAPQRRQRAVAVWAAMSGAGGVVGNVGGGAVLSAGSWRWLFVAVVPVALGSAAAVALVAPRTDHHRRPLSPLTPALLTSATLGLLVGVIQGPEQGWSSALVVGAFGSAAVLSGAWVVCELRSDAPLLDPRLFRIAALRAACLGMMVVFFGLFGLFYLNASLLQYGRGFSVLAAGVGIVPMTVPLLVAARYVPELVQRLGQRTVLALAFATTAGGLLGLAEAIPEPYPWYALWLVVVGAGVTLALPTLTIAISAGLPQDQAGVAGGLQATTRELGSALGVAVIGTLLTARFAQRLQLIPGGVSTAAGARPRSLPAALASAPGHAREVLETYTSSAATALRVVALIVVLAGVLVITESARADRRERLTGSGTRPGRGPGWN